MKISSLLCIFTLIATAVTARINGDSLDYSLHRQDTSLQHAGYNDHDMTSHKINAMVSNAHRELGARYLDPSYQLSEREYIEIERRQALQAAEFAIKGIMKIVEAITGAIQGDKDKRNKWTATLVGKLGQKFPVFNFAVCHTDHKMEAKGKQGHDWGHIHHEVPVSFGKTVGYEIYWFREGTFHRYGDGGYLNWAYYGNPKSTSNGGKDVVFGPR